MNFDDLQQTWTQQTVAGTRIDAARLREKLAHEARQRTRAVRRIIGVTLFVLLSGWSVVLGAHFTGIKPLNGLTALSFVTISVFDLACLLLALRALRRMRREELSVGATLADAVQASLRAVESQMRDCRWFGYALAIEFAGEVGGTLLFYATCDLPQHGVFPKLFLAIVPFGAIAVTLRRYYRRKLIPRRAELRSELANLQRESGS